MGPTRFPNPCVCKICDKEVPYRERKRCLKCGEWIHNHCSHTLARLGYRAECFDCLPPFSSMELIDQFMQELDGPWEPETYKSGAIFFASLHLGPDEQKIAQLTGYSPEEISLRGDRLRKSRVWANGKVYLEPNPDDDWRVANIIFLMAVLCADGVIERKSDSEESAGSQSTAADAGAEGAADTHAKP